MSDRGHRNKETCQGKWGPPPPTTCPSPPPPAEPVSPAFLLLWLLSVPPPSELGLSERGRGLGISDGRGLCSSLFPLADLCSGGLLELPATLARPGGLSAQPLPRCLLGEEGVDFQLSVTRKKKRKKISQATTFHRDQQGGKAMPRSSAKPARKPAGHPSLSPPTPPTPHYQPHDLGQSPSP